MESSIYKKFLSFLENERYYPYFVLMLGVFVIFFNCTVPWVQGTK
ncbi:MAG: hypothetical protein PHI66_01675 [Candidatus Pacebacteria bacterium]|nr:hypothetical protein [Candidatus Paceibacterota bacterium]